MNNAPSQTGVWYHGSPLQLSTLRAGSTITPYMPVAEVFSHKPQIVVVRDDGSIRHSGTDAGWLHTVAEPVSPLDIYPHPRTTMGLGWEWLTRRDLRVQPLRVASVIPEQALVPADMTEHAVQADSLVFRPIHPTDQATARDLILQGLGEHFGYIDESLNPDLDDIASHYATVESAMIVAMLDGALVGTGALTLIDVNSAQMVRVSVSNAHRRRGIARAVVNQLITLARLWGFERIEVETNYDWMDAIGLYRSLGFIEHSRDEVSVYMALGLH